LGLWEKKLRIFKNKNIEGYEEIQNATIYDIKIQNVSPFVTPPPKWWGNKIK
jgi:hypothetical protein